MVDQVSPERRSENMRRVKGKDTAPELRVRRLLHALGLRFRLHRKDLPGKPDLVFPRYKTAVFIHGCFWHRHQGCRRATMPKSKVEYWTAKFRRNVERDARMPGALAEIGWRHMQVWECEVSDSPEFALGLASRIRCDVVLKPDALPD